MFVTAQCVLSKSTNEWKTRTVYQLLTDRFARSDGSTQGCGNLSNYCGGSYRGIINKLDYIQDMGFDAIWVSPIIENTDGGYHGYWAKNLYQLNQSFGSEQDFKDLVNEAHKRDIWIMVDIVANHVGPVGQDYGQIYPFDKSEHYHDYCVINQDDFQRDQWRVENCRLADLPDLNQQNQWVRDTLKNWIRDLIQKYNIDGLRIDTVAEVPKDFWKEFTDAAGVYAVGEVFDGRHDYVADYQNYMPALLNYPVYFTALSVFAYGNSCMQIRPTLDSVNQKFRDVDALGVFSDNHDNPRFINRNGSHTRLKSYLAFNMFQRGIPIVYYGTEQGYGGGNDPQNREQLWTNFDPNHELYQFISQLVKYRKRLQTWNGEYVERYQADNFYIFSKGQVLVFVSNNDGDYQQDLTYHPYHPGDVICNIFSDHVCQNVQQDNKITVNLRGGEPSVYVPQGSLTQEDIETLKEQYQKDLSIEIVQLQLYQYQNYQRLIAFLQMSSLYVFKGMKPVLMSDQFIDVILSKTQRKTATVVHPGYAITRIRAFYMQKVKFCASSFSEKLDQILKDFPKLDDIHPFFADLLNVLYDKDHYKIALGQVNVVKAIIEKIAKDYVTLMKYADSLYRCKTLKVASFGRMCTAIKKIKPSLQYLEEVRKHLSRLPNIDPFLPTVLFFGFPNVGKSSFINKVSKAKVEESPMPFSTQNLFVGHGDYKHVRVQYIDSPGVLNRPLDQRNTIEMQSITALAHLKCVVVFIVDISESCGHDIEDQLKLYDSLKPLFANKPSIVALNKTDLVTYENLEQEQKNLIENFQQQNQDIVFLQLSCQEQDKVDIANNTVCEMLMQFRMQNNKNLNNSLKNDEDYFRGVTVIHPNVQRDTTQRQTYIPDSVKQKIQTEQVEKKKTLKDMQEEFGGAGVFNFPWNEHFMLENNEWKYDKVPEIMDGNNIIDYVDPDIEQKILALEQETPAKIPDEEMLNEEELEDIEALERTRDAKYVKKLDAKINNNRRVSKLKFNVKNLRDRLQKQGKDSQKAERRLNMKKSKIAQTKLRKEMGGMELEEQNQRKRLREKKSLRSQWNDEQFSGEKRRRKIQKQRMRSGLSGDADHRIFTKKPKHLFAGKMGSGTSNKR